MRDITTDIAAGMSLYRVSSLPCSHFAKLHPVSAQHHMLELCWLQTHYNNSPEISLAEPANTSPYKAISIKLPGICSGWANSECITHLTTHVHLWPPLSPVIASMWVEWSRQGDSWHYSMHYVNKGTDIAYILNVRVTSRNYRLEHTAGIEKWRP